MLNFIAIMVILGIPVEVNGPKLSEPVIEDIVRRTQELCAPRGVEGVKIYGSEDGQSLAVAYKCEE